MDYIKHWGMSILAALGFMQPETKSPAALETINFNFNCDSINYNMTFVHGDITQQNVDVIVNAANENLNHGGGVALAISKAAGPALQNYCNTMPLIDGISRCPMGKAVITPAFNLEKVGIKKIIHTTGPRGNTPQKEQFLHDCYQNCLTLAAQNGLRTIAFPSISTAIFGYDINKAAPIAVRAIKDYIDKHPHDFDNIQFVLFSQQDFDVYKKSFLNY
jgi:O-acetyl-ADP-ribose deacetylase (regulator of RNase III)